MTIRNLDKLFHPQSVVLVCSGDWAHRVGEVCLDNLHSAGRVERVLVVDAGRRKLLGQSSYAKPTKLPYVPDLAVIAAPPDEAVSYVHQLGELGARAAIVLGGGLIEAQQGYDADQQRRLLEAAKPYLMRILGPDTLGAIVTGSELNASLAPIAPRPGGLAFVSHSGAIINAMLDWAGVRGIGFSHLVGLGDMADVDFADMLDFLANDSGTRAILLYMESIRHTRKFLSAARLAARMKPVIVVKADRGDAAAGRDTHSAALLERDGVYDAAFRRAGMLRVEGLEELFEAAEILSRPVLPRSDRLAIVTNTRGMGVIAVDALRALDGRLAELGPKSSEALSEVLSAGHPGGNPLYLVGRDAPDRYATTLRALAQDRDVDAILAIHCPTATYTDTEVAQVVAEQSRGARRKPVLTSWVGHDAAEPARQVFRDRGIPTYETPDQAIRAFMYTVRYQRVQRTLMETPPSLPETFTPDPDTAEAVVRSVRAERRTRLDQAEAKRLLSAYGIPVVEPEVVSTPDEAAAAAARIGAPVVLKVESPDILHKSEVGGVVTDLAGPDAVREAAAASQRRVAEARPGARLTGLTVEPMIQRRWGYELLAGMATDPLFGPVMVFGQGGMAVEVIRDAAMGLPPLNMHLAHDLIARTRIYRLLKGSPSQPPVDLDQVALTLIKLSQLVCDISDIAEMDINPLLADRDGVVALDARVHLCPPGTPGGYPAIRPYPKELEEAVTLDNGRRLLLRPIRPEDEPVIRRGFNRLSSEQVRLRFFSPFKALTHSMAARLTQIDYDREMALVLTEGGKPGRTPIYAVVRLHADPDGESAEYAIIVDQSMTGRGIGAMLMERIIDYARRQGIREIWGHVLRENTAMLNICKRFGFRRSMVPGEPDLVRVSLRLD